MPDRKNEPGFRKPERDPFQPPSYVLVCNNSDCLLRLSIGRPQYGERCPRCDCPMSLKRQD